MPLLEQSTSSSGMEEGKDNLGASSSMRDNDRYITYDLASEEVMPQNTGTKPKILHHSSSSPTKLPVDSQYLHMGSPTSVGSKRPLVSSSSSPREYANTSMSMEEESDLFESSTLPVKGKRDRAVPPSELNQPPVLLRQNSRSCEDLSEYTRMSLSLGTPTSPYINPPALVNMNRQRSEGYSYADPVTLGAVGFSMQPGPFIQDGNINEGYISSSLQNTQGVQQIKKLLYTQMNRDKNAYKSASNPNLVDFSQVPMSAAPSAGPMAMKPASHNSPAMNKRSPNVKKLDMSLANGARSNGMSQTDEDNKAPMLRQDSMDFIDESDGASGKVSPVKRSSRETVSPPRLTPVKDKEMNIGDESITVTNKTKSYKKRGPKQEEVGGHAISNGTVEGILREHREGNPMHGRRLPSLPPYAAEQVHLETTC